MANPSQKASPNPTTTEEELEADLPGFAAARTPPLPDPLDPDVTTIREPGASTAEDLPDDEIPWDDSPAGDARSAKTSPKGGTGSSPGSTEPPGSIGDVLDPLAFREVFAMGLEGAGLFAHHRLAKGAVVDEHDAVGNLRRHPLWTFDDQDLDAIATPLSKIAARHMPIKPGPASDVADGIEAGMGAAGYVVKNLRRRAELARAWGQQSEQNAPGAPAA